MVVLFEGAKAFFISLKMQIKKNSLVNPCLKKAQKILNYFSKPFS